MRVGIYNRWLATLGGGEKYSLAIAEFLARNHAVQVISHRPVSNALASERLNLDLANVEFVTIPDRPTVELASITADFDFFINASFLDMFSSFARHSALVVYFPIPLSVNRTKRIYAWGGRILKRLLMVPSFMGVLDNQAYENSQMRLTGSRIKIELPYSREGYWVRFDLASKEPNVCAAAIQLNGRSVETLALPVDQGFVSYKGKIPGMTGTLPAMLSIQACFDDSSRHDLPIKLALNNFAIVHPRYSIYQFLFERWLKNWGIRLHRTPYRMAPILDSVDTYQVIWSISQFTKRWVTNYWNRPSSLLYPPVDVDQFHPANKLKQILSVGRFFAGSHNKKHDVMIAAFKMMIEQGLTGWELHLVGGTSPGQEHQNYLAQLFAEAKSYPIVIHTDIPFERLQHLYSSSAIYWHAGGFGENEDQEPIKFEHFGITTVEAMASGCVPVVLGKGGQTEIVKNAHNGFLWHTVNELIEQTRQLVNDDTLRQRLALSAIADSKLYDRAHFNTHLETLLDQIGIS
ncbi:MAG: glycosyltransferase [Chloroflexi bacterium]|nr:glycosyltransferase [Chloroflexota bacterium]